MATEQERLYVSVDADEAQEMAGWGVLNTSLEGIGMVPPPAPKLRATPLPTVMSSGTLASDMESDSEEDGDCGLSDSDAE